MTANPRVAIVTGGARGIGRRTAELLASRGYRVIIIDLHDPVETLRAIAAAGTKRALCWRPHRSRCHRTFVPGPSIDMAASTCSSTMQASASSRRPNIPPSAICAASRRESRRAFSVVPGRRNKNARSAQRIHRQRSPPSPASSLSPIAPPTTPPSTDWSASPAPSPPNGVAAACASTPSVQAGSKLKWMQPTRQAAPTPTPTSSPASPWPARHARRRRPRRRLPRRSRREPLRQRPHARS